MEKEEGKHCQRGTYCGFCRDPRTRKGSSFSEGHTRKVKLLDMQMQAAGFTSLAGARQGRVILTAVHASEVRSAREMVLEIIRKAKDAPSISIAIARSSVVGVSPPICGSLSY